MSWVGVGSGMAHIGLIAIMICSCVNISIGHTHLHCLVSSTHSHTQLEHPLHYCHAHFCHTLMFIMQLRQLLSQLPDDNLLDDPDCTVTSLDYDDHAYHHQVDDSGSIVGTTYGLIPESRAMVSESDFYPNTSQTYIPDTEGENAFHYSFHYYV